MTRTHARRRTAVTLIELLVVIAIMTALLALAAALAPSIASSDQTQKGAAELQSACKVAQGFAAATGRPHGVRLIVTAGNPNNTTGYFCTELQYLESPPVLVADPQVLVRKPRDSGGGTGSGTGSGPRVEFTYTLYTGVAPDTSINPVDGTIPPLGTIKTRACFIRGISPETADQITAGAVLSLPAASLTWSRILAVTGRSGAYTSPATGAPAVDLTVTLDVYPDTLLGAATVYRSYHFGVYGAPVPVLAEATVPMPKEIVIDLEVSQPPLPGPGTDYDILFAPNGQPVSSGNIGVGKTATNANAFFLVRDRSKLGTSINLSGPALGTAFRRAGEMQVVGIRAGGHVGVAPATQADDNGNFPAAYPDLFGLAREQLDR
ncbi:MAG: hypothetical protein FJ304_01700 [Planctomycetes bacterium]|nr:hypothetical protein [Planctomycetota bacterium]